MSALSPRILKPLCTPKENEEYELGEKRPRSDMLAILNFSIISPLTPLIERGVSSTGFGMPKMLLFCWVKPLRSPSTLATKRSNFTTDSSSLVSSVGVLVVSWAKSPEAKNKKKVQWDVDERKCLRI